MATNNLGIRFTEETYASRIEVAKALGTNLIDPFWNAILSYRKPFISVLSIRDISKLNLELTLCNKVNEKCSSLDARLLRYRDAFEKQVDGSMEKATFLHDVIRQDLLYVARTRSTFVNEVALNNIIAHKSQDPTYEKLINYYSALEYIASHKVSRLDDKVLAALYSCVTGEGELLSYYRSEEISSSQQNVIINREYVGAPTSMIEMMMDNLLDFVNNSTYSVAIKASVAYYMVNYIKPFAQCNEEISVLLAKQVIAMSEVGGAAAFIPCANLIAERQSELSSAFKESQKTRDITYVLLNVVEMVDVATQFALDKMVQLTVSGVQRSYVLGEDEEAIKSEFGVSFEEKPSEPKVREPKVKKVSEPVRSTEPKAAPTLSDEPTEKELRKAAEELLESDPMLRPGQAHFYVRHCVKGRYYTIQQYKKAEGCVYETARTSMDNLAKQGYYKREQVKNKFVYTPIIKQCRIEDEIYGKRIQNICRS